MSPRKIMLIRHGEKPSETEFGVDRYGDRSDDELTVRGWQRAGALVQFFAGPDRRDPEGVVETPTSLFAAGPTEAHPSKRSKHTLTPLAKFLGMEIDLEAARGQEEDLVAAIRAETGVVLVAWEHKAINDIVGLLTNDEVVPPEWPDDRFDMVWVLSTAPHRLLIQHPQRLLAGDGGAFER